MNAVPPDSPAKKWTWTRWLTLIAIVFVIHVALIFIFGAKKPTPPLQVKNAPTLALAAESGGDWLTLHNATLFGLPSQDGFAGLMWEALPPLPFRQQDWTEKPRWLTETDSLSVGELVMPFNRFVQTNRFAEIHFEFNAPPRVMVPALPTESLFATASTLEVKGDLANRQLLNPITPPTLPSTDVMAPSKVQVLVDGAGNVVSAVLLPSGNFVEASATADSDAEQRAQTLALQLARAARFSPLTPDAVGLKSNPAARLSVGLLIFNWQTMPESAAKDAANKEKL